MRNSAVTNTFSSWVVVLSASLFFFYIFVQMTMFNAINDDFATSLCFDAQQLSGICSCYFFGNVLFLFPAGMILDRFSVKKSLLIAYVVAVIATYVFAVASDLKMLSLARFVIGMSGAFAFLSVVKLASQWFDSHKIALVIGVVVMLATCGGIVAQTPLAMFGAAYGWRKAVMVVAALGAVFILVQLFLVKDRSIVDPLNPKYTRSKMKTNFWFSLKMALTCKQNWLGGTYISLLNLPLFIFGGSWGLPYLMQVHNFELFQATIITTFMFVGMAIGSPIAGLISDRLGLRKRPMIIGSLAAIVLILLIMYAPTYSLSTEILIYFALGFFMAFQVIGYPVITESNPDSIVATAASVGSVLIMSGGILVVVYGWLLKLSAGVSSTVTKQYLARDFLYANYFVLGSVIAALIAALLIKETYGRSLGDKKDNE